MPNSKDNRTAVTAGTHGFAPAPPRHGSVPTWAEYLFGLSPEPNDHSVVKEGRNTDRLLTKREVRELTGVPYSSMYALIKRSEFPPPRRIRLIVSGGWNEIAPEG